ncbi:MAG: polysaccharide deacetylase family protein [bacterium]
MLEILIPDNFIPERSYVIEVIFKEFLGLNYKITVQSDELQSTVICLSDKKIIFEDHFFSKYSENYLEINNLPQNIIFSQNEFTPESDIPVIYGNSTVEISDNYIKCGIDIFSSVFFMLSRWEEYVNPVKDSIGRFPAIASIAYKNNFLERPVVNEYVEMLWNMLKYYNFQQERAVKKSEIFLTHDVDVIDRPFKGKHAIKSLLNMFIFDMKLLQSYNKKLHFNIFKFIYNPYDIFDWLLEIVEQNEIKSYFYFMSDRKTGRDGTYKLDNPLFYKIIKKIENHKQIIGFHPSFSSFDNAEIWQQEKQMLENALGYSVKEGRQHYLNFSVPLTWQIWEDNKMTADSSCGYADKVGFRCGTGDLFSVFNVLTRKKLNLKERPLILMDSTLTCYLKSSQEENINLINKFNNLSEKYNMALTYLTHNTIFHTNKEYFELYLKIISFMKARLS